MGRRAMTLVGAALLGLFGLAGGARAQGVDAPKAVVVTALNLTGSHEQPARTGALSGDTVRMEITFTNVTGRPAKNVTFADPLPASLTLVGGSVGASAPVKVEYSTDGGATYAGQQPSVPGTVTDVRWTVNGSVMAGAKVTAHFLAVVAPRPGK